MTVKRPVIGITMGDPASIGPEITLKALNKMCIRDSHHCSKPYNKSTGRINC